MPELKLDLNNLPENFSEIGHIEEDDRIPKLDIDNLPRRFSEITSPESEAEPVTYDDLDIDKLTTQMKNNPEVDDETAKFYSGILLAYKINNDPTHPSQVNPFDENIYNAQARAYYGQDHDLKPQEIYKGLVDSMVPKKSDPEWKDWDKYIEVITKQEAGEEVPDVDLYDPWEEGFREAGLGVMAGIDITLSGLTGTNVNFQQYELKTTEKAEVKAFMDSVVAQRKLGHKVLSPRAQRFAERSLLTKHFNYGTFSTLSEAEKQYFHTYISAINTEKDLGFLNEIGETIGMSYTDITASFKATARMFEEHGSGLLDSKILYLRTKNIKDKDKLRKYIKENLKDANIRGEIAPAFFGATGSFAPASKSEDQSEIDTNRIMENYDELMEQGKQDYDRFVEGRRFLMASRKKFVEHEGKAGTVRDLFMKSVSIGLDLVGAAVAGIGTGGAGTLIYSGSRFAGDTYETLVYDYDVDPSDAAGIALVTAIPYAFIEKAQIGLLTRGPLKQSAKELMEANFVSGWRKFSIDYVKTYGAEVTQETAQSFIEQMAYAYSKEFKQANNVDYSQLLDNVIVESIEAAQAMIFTAGLGPVQRSATGQAILSKIPIIGNKYNLLDGQTSMDELAEESPHNFDAVEGVQAQDLDSKFWNDYDLAKTDQEKQDTIEYHQMDIDIEEANTVSEIRQKVKADLPSKAQEHLEQEQRELESIEQGRQIFEQEIKESVGEFATVEVIDADNFKIIGKGGAEAFIQKIDDTEFTKKYGEGKLGAWNPNTSTMVFPRSAEDFTLAHENVHMMRDLGLITDSELNQLVKDGKTFATPEFMESIKKLDQEGQNQELTANLIEEMKRTGNIPEGLDTVWQKIKDWIRDFGSKFTTLIERSGKAIAKDILAGKPLGRPGKAVAKQENKVEKIKESLAEETMSPEEQAILEEELEQAEQSLIELKEQEELEAEAIHDQLIEEGDVEAQEIREESIRQPMIEFLKQIGGIKLDDAIKSSLKNAGIMGGYIKTFFKTKASTSWDQAIPQMVEEGLIKPNQIDGIDEFIEHVRNTISKDPVRFSFAGIKAAKADLSMLKKAEEMELNGDSAKDILEKTGWFKATDGNWKFEIDTENIDVWIKPGTRFTKLSEIMRGKGSRSMYEQYPGLADIKIEVVENMRSDAAINIAENTIRFKASETRSEAATKKLLFHEIQHWIQELEEFAKGGSLKNVREHTSKEGITKTEFEIYESFAGEVEARNVESRLGLTKVEKVEKDPLSTEDVATQDQILRFSKEQQSDKERLAVVNLAKKLYRGEAMPIGLDPVLARKAMEVVKEAKAEIKATQDDVTINKEIRKAEVRQHYATKVVETFRTGFEAGIKIEAKEHKIRKSIQDKKEKAFKVPDKVRAISETTTLADIENQVLDALILEGVIKEKTPYASDFQYIKSIKTAVANILRAKMAEIPPGKDKTDLWNRIKNIKHIKTASSTMREASRILKSIDEAKIKRSNQQLIEDFEETLEKALNNIAKGQLVKSKEGQIDPLTGQFLKLINEVKGMSQESVLSKVQDIQDMLNDKNKYDKFAMQRKIDEWIGEETKIYKKGKNKGKEYKTYKMGSLRKKFISPEQTKAGLDEDIVTKLIILHKALYEFGAMSSKTKVKKHLALEALKDAISGSVVKLEKARAKMAAEAAGNLKAMVPGVVGHGKQVGTWEKWLASFTGPALGIKSLFEVAQKNSTGKVREDSQSAFNQLFSAIHKAENVKDVAVMDTQTQLFEGIAENYGVKIGSVLKVLGKLTKLNKSYGKYSKQGNAKLSKLHLFQFITALEQDAYKKNKKMHLRDSDIEAMKAELTPQDLDMIQWFKDFYADGRADLSAKVNEILGIPFQEEDMNYAPVIIKRDEEGLPNVFSGTTVVPAALTPRVDHQNDLDESVTMLDIFIGRNEQNQFFLAGANTMQMLEMVFGNKDMHKAIEDSLGKSGKKYFYSAVQDWINNGWQFDSKWKSLDYVRNFFTISKFAYNPRIGIKQLTSIPAFALEISSMNVMKYLGNSVTTTEGRAAIMEILNHPLTKDRMQVGPLEEIRHLMGSTPNEFRAFMKHAMIFNKYGDIIPTLLIGQGVLRANYEVYKQNMPDKEAKEKAMFDVFELAQRTQQSGKQKELAYWQRRFGSAGRTAAIFTNTTRQFLEFELVAAQKLAANPADMKNWKQMGKVMVINHLLLPAAYQGMNIIINMILGDEADDDDKLNMMLAMIVGPFSGYIFFGAMFIGFVDAVGRSKKVRGALGVEKARGSMTFGAKGYTPMTGILNDIKTAGEIITSEDMDEAEAKFLKLMKSLLAPVREVDKFLGNQ